MARWRLVNGEEGRTGRRLFFSSSQSRPRGSAALCGRLFFPTLSLFIAAMGGRRSACSHRSGRASRGDKGKRPRRPPRKRLRPVTAPFFSPLFFALLPLPLDFLFCACLPRARARFFLALKHCPTAPPPRDPWLWSADIPAYGDARQLQRRVVARAAHERRLQDGRHPPVSRRHAAPIAAARVHRTGVGAQYGRSRRTARSLLFATCGCAPGARRARTSSTVRAATAASASASASAGRRVRRSVSRTDAGGARDGPARDCVRARRSRTAESSTFGIGHGCRRRVGSGRRRPSVCPPEARRRGVARRPGVSLVKAARPD